ncbi:MAG: putative transporter, partial [Jatrophihabitantaceae bacterium]|nr:putative transporter [Jatrophihabitantaceae bacterium]
MKAPRELGDRLSGLREVVRLGGGRVGPELLEPVEALLSQASARRSLSPDRTVVALAGGTGSGKSSLFNAIAGGEL